MRKIEALDIRYTVPRVIVSEKQLVWQVKCRAILRIEERFFLGICNDGFSYVSGRKFEQQLVVSQHIHEIS